MRGRDPGSRAPAPRPRPDGSRDAWRGRDRRHALPELSDREFEILDLMASGCANEIIAHRLGLTLKTVRNHVSNIYAKLLVADRAQAVIRARDAGLGRSTRA